MFLKTLEKNREHFRSICNNTDASINEKYMSFSRFMQELFLPEDSYVISSGNFEDVNLAMLSMIINRIRRHPHIWNLFFRKF